VVRGKGGGRERKRERHRERETERSQRKGMCLHCLRSNAQLDAYFTSGASKTSGSLCMIGGKMAMKSPFRRQQLPVSELRVKSSSTKRMVLEYEHSRRTSKMVLSERDKQ
jgi:hypothetical protein